MIDWIESNGRGGRKATTRYVAIAVTTAGTNAKKDRPRSLAIRFGIDAQKSMRLIKGDRLLVGVDKTTKQICFKRVTEGGYALSGPANRQTGVLRVQLSTDLPWHAAVEVEKTAVHDEGTHTAIDAPDFFSK